MIPVPGGWEHDWEMHGLLGFWEGRDLNILVLILNSSVFHISVGLDTYCVLEPEKNMYCPMLLLSIIKHMNTE